MQSSVDRSTSWRAIPMYAFLSLIACGFAIAWPGALGHGTEMGDEPAWRSLPLVTDGKVAEGWRQVGWGGFVVDDGALRTECDPKGLGLLVYDKERFGNCQIRVVFKSKDSKSNAGVHVRIADGILEQVDHPGVPISRGADGSISPESMRARKESAEREEGPWFAVHRGYEVQIMDENDPLHRTGAIYSLAASSATSSKAPGEWRTMVITLAGERIFVDLDGRRITSFDPGSPELPKAQEWFDPKREPKRPEVGYIGLQNHFPGDVVWFKDVSVRKLGDGAAKDTTAKDAAPIPIPPWVTTGTFHWEGSPSLLHMDPSKGLPPATTQNPWETVRDPSVVFYADRWHLFASILKRRGGEPGRVRIGYMSFSDWSQAQVQDWHLIELYSPGDSIDYHGAPQIFFFAPQKKWYLVYQLVDKARGIEYGPCYSTSNDVSDPASWTLPTRLWLPQPGIQQGLDHWIICDDQKCHHFYTTLDGNIWRAETLIGDFPAKWSTPVVAVRGNIFEAAHTYKIVGIDKYVTVADTHGNDTVGERIQTAYVADRLDGPWKALADTNAKSFASLTNTVWPAGKWTNTIDHGELIRAGYDQKMEIDPNNLRWVYQGKTDIPYPYDFQLGMLTFK